MEPELDPAFPKGCLSNCPTRSQISEKEKEKDEKIEKIEKIEISNNIDDIDSIGINKKKKISICNA